jgi:hypothetical protein
VGKDAKDETLKGFSSVNRAGTRNEVYNPTSYIMVIMIIILITMMNTITLLIGQ